METSTKTSASDAALATPLDAYIPYLQTIATRLVEKIPPTDASAADLVQAALLAALRQQADNAEPWRNETHRKRWLVMVLKNKWRDAVRPRPVPVGGLVEEPTASSSGASTKFDDAERWERFQRALATLSQRDRELVRWRLFDEISVAEIARRSGLSKPGARYACDAARQRLENALSAIATAPVAAT